MGVLAYSQEKVKVAVVPFSYTGTTYKLSQRLAEFAENKLASVLYGTGRFVLVERSQLSKVLDELKFNKGGLVSDKDAIRLGEFSGASYIITGSVTNYSYKTAYQEACLYFDIVIGDSKSSRPSKPPRIRVETGSMVLHIKMLDVKTGEVEFAKSYTINDESSCISEDIKGEEGFLTYVLSQTISNSVWKDFKSQFPVRGTIVLIESKKSILIDIGSANGVYKGAIVEVVATQNIRNSSGNLITITKNIATLRIVNVLGNEVAECKLVKGNKKTLREGMNVVFK